MAHILIANDHPLFRDALRGVASDVFADAPCTFDCAEAGDLDETMRIAESGQALDLVLLDLNLPGADGMSHLLTLRHKRPNAAIIVLSATPDTQLVTQAMICGATGFVSKAAFRSEFESALQTVFGGGVYLPNMPARPLQGPMVPLPGVRRRPVPVSENWKLTGRQLAVMDLVAAGKSNKQIAWELTISETTVKAHMTEILRKLSVNSRAQAIVLFRRHVTDA